jgi:phage shock protein PspC (stress-responsive transcriptional regulator)
MTKKLHRSNDRVFGGVCAGFAEYMDFDPVAVRLGYAALTLFTAFAGIPFYIVAWIIIPPKNDLQR